MKRSWLKYLVISGIIVGLGVYLFQKVDLTTADLGRHITNGRMILQGHFNDIVSRNFYSYTYPDSPFINHHWLTGIIFYLGQKTVGIGGLTLIYFGLLLASLLIALKVQPKLHPLVILSVIPLVLPLVGYRYEIRPEGFSYLLFSLVWLIVHNCYTGRWTKKILWWLPAIMLIWVNLHIYFIFGLGLMAAYLIWSLLEKKFDRTLLLVGIASAAASCINPFGLTGLTYPLNIFRSYGYDVLENMSALFLIKHGLGNPVYLWIIILVSVLVITTVWQYLVGRSKQGLIIQLLAIFMGLLAMSAVRNTALFGLTAAVALGINCQRLVKHYFDNAKRVLTVMAVIAWLLIGVSFSPSIMARANANGWGLGEAKGCGDMGKFIRDNKITGPIFNDYDIGGCLIYELYPDVKPFVDNRPEAYPADFFAEEYIPIQADGKIWNRAVDRYQFNAIIVYRGDLTSWTQALLTRAGQDESWVRVYMDGKIIVLVRNTPQNQAVIEKFGQ